MKYLNKLKEWSYIKLDSWLARISAENCHVSYEFDHLSGDSDLFTSSDKIFDGRG